MTTTDDLSRDTPASTTDTGSQRTAENRSITVDGDSLVYRRFGNEQEDSLNLFFSGSEGSRAKGTGYLGRAYSRQIDRDAPTDLATRDAQLAAITDWGIPDASKLNRLAGITQPTFVANGDNDTMMHTKNSHLLAEQLPNAQLRIYPDANHGFLDQYPELFADHVTAFLNGYR